MNYKQKQQSFVGLQDAIRTCVIKIQFLWASQDFLSLKSSYLERESKGSIGYMQGFALRFILTIVYASQKGISL